MREHRARPSSPQQLQPLGLRCRSGTLTSPQLPFWGASPRLLSCPRQQPPRRCMCTLHALAHGGEIALLKAPPLAHSVVLRGPLNHKACS